MSSTSDGAAPSAVIDRLALLLDAFDGPGHLTLAQVARRTGLPRSSAHRMLERLVQLRWLRRDGNTYALGMRIFELGSLVVHQDQVHKAALPFMHDLHGATRLVVHLAVLDGRDVVYLDKIGGRFSTVLPSRVGGRQPAHCTSVGKVLLAFSQASVNETYAGGRLEQRTAHSISSVVQLNRELTKVREHGVAFDREEAVPGVGCVAVPIGDVGTAVAALSVCGPVAKVRPEQLVTPMRMTAMGIWRAANAPAAGRSPWSGIPTAPHAVPPTTELARAGSPRPGLPRTAPGRVPAGMAARRV